MSRVIPDSLEYMFNHEMHWVRTYGYGRYMQLVFKRTLDDKNSLRIRPSDFEYTQRDYDQSMPIEACCKVGKNNYELELLVSDNMYEGIDKKKYRKIICASCKTRGHK